MSNGELNELVDRQKRGERGLGGLILEHIAKDVYDRPEFYGFRSEDDVGEVFVRYWARIGGLAERYENIGYNFESFLVSSMRYMARSIRRQHACGNDREQAFNEDAKAALRSESASGGEDSAVRRNRRKHAGFPRRDDRGVSASAFRRRMLFICVKCANVIDDDEAEGIARAAGMDVGEVLRTVALARTRGLGQRQRTESRRRGRDAAWLRMGAASRRLTRETDIETRQYLVEAIERDRGLYLRAVKLIARSSPIVSNKAVAELLGIPKGTVDCGVGRIMRHFSALYSDRVDV